MEQPARRGHRRAVGPPGAYPSAPEPTRDPDQGDPDQGDPADRRPPQDDDERFRADRPPHHDRER